jgi:hypothetical protein
MEYVEEIIDRETGDLKTCSLGDWITVTELGKEKGEGPRRTRSILAKMEVLQLEGNGRRSRHRVVPWVTERGWAKRLNPMHGHPFDVLGPDMQAWIDKRWSSARSSVLDRTSAPHVKPARDALAAFKDQRHSADMEVRCQVVWLLDHYPSLSQSDIGALVDVSQQLVQRLVREREVQIARAREWKSASPNRLSNLKLPLVNL